MASYLAFPHDNRTTDKRVPFVGLHVLKHSSHVWRHVSNRNSPCNSTEMSKFKETEKYEMHKCVWVKELTHACTDNYKQINIDAWV